MKKLLLSTAALLTVGISGAQADPSTDSAQLTLAGEMAKACTISTFQNNGDLTDLDLTVTTESNADSISVTCNFGGATEVELSSANAGELVSGSNSIPYTASVTGGLMTDQSLASPFSIPNWPVTLGTPQTRSFKVKLSPPAVVPAGTYEDTVTATVYAN